MTSRASLDPVSRLRYSPPFLPLDVELLSIEELVRRASPERLQQPSRAEFFRCLGMLEGALSLTVDFQRETLLTGHWRVVQPGQVLQYHLTDPPSASGWLLVFKPEALLRAQDDTGRGALPVTTHLAWLRSVLVLGEQEHKWMHRCCQRMQLDARLEVSGEVRNALLRWQLAALLTRMACWQQQHHQGVQLRHQGQHHYQRFIDLLEAHHAQQHQVQYYAAQLGLSTRTLNRAVQSAIGLSAKQCIAQRVVLEAKRLLSYSDAPCQAIGLSLGFHEATQFSKFFRMHTNQTPQAFRAAVQRTLEPVS